MVAFVFEGVVVAIITGVFLLLGTWLQNRQTRQKSKDQHAEQTSMLTTLVQNQHTIKQTLDAHRTEVAREIAEVKGQVGGVIEAQGILFGMIADVDQKVSEKTNTRKPVSIGANVHE